MSVYVSVFLDIYKYIPYLKLFSSGKTLYYKFS